MAQDIVAALQGLGQTLEQLGGSVYANAGFRMVEAVKQGMRNSRMRQRTGNLYRSVGFIAQDDGVVLTMLDYGFYQNFGVVGTEGDPGTREVTFGLKPKDNRKKYEFTESSVESAREKNVPGWMLETYYFGIRAKSFIDETELEDILGEEMLIAQLRAVENTFTNEYII